MASVPVIPVSLITSDNLHHIAIHPVELYHATFLVEIQYLVDILDHFKVFEVSVHPLISPNPRALFRGIASVREAGFFFNVETTLNPPLGPFRTALAIRTAALSYLHAHNLSPPVQRRKYATLAKNTTDINKKCRQDASLTPSQKMSIMIRPSFDWYPCMHSITTRTTEFPSESWRLRP